jgi:hypothetical protein
MILQTLWCLSLTHRKLVVKHPSSAGVMFCRIWSESKSRSRIKNKLLAMKSSKNAKFRIREKPHCAARLRNVELS